MGSLYSGSISGIEWREQGGNNRGYNYTFDKNKRLTRASYYDAVGGDGRFSTSYSYDNMGNITSLKRSGNHNNGSYGVIDDLTYSYNGYQLVAVDDAATSPDINDSFDFKDGADASVEYLYDANGNMVQDKNKGIAQIQYNHLNMPTRITYDNGNMIDYLYSASGAKLEVTHTTNKLLMVNSNIGNSAAAKVLQQTTDLLTIDEPALAGRTSVQAPAASNLDVQTTDYINGYILENGALSQIQLNGGYMTEDSQGKAVYHFYLQDHQGNNRVVVNGKTLAVEQVNHYYPYGGLFAESTGGEMQAFKYNGKELDRVCGLNWYDHGARHNDAAIGRWHCIDPLAEKYYSISPYVYCADNPVMFVDLSGMAPDSIEAAQMAKHVYQDENVELVGGWSCVRLSYDDKTGLQYGIYQRCNSAESIETCLVFAGTNDGTDTKLDYEQYNGMGNEIWDTQYGQAALIALSQMASLAPGEELSFSGHSLGGALAQIASMMTDAPAITFNPAGIHNKTMSELGLIGANTSQIQNYVISGEVVSMSTMANANVKTYGNTNYRTYNYSRFNEIAIYQSAQNHKMKNF